jgi:hypothetical protein
MKYVISVRQMSLALRGNYIYVYGLTLSRAEYQLPRKPTGDAGQCSDETESE